MHLHHRGGQLPFVKSHSLRWREGKVARDLLHLWHPWYSWNGGNGVNSWHWGNGAGSKNNGHTKNGGEMLLFCLVLICVFVIFFSLGKQKIAKHGVKSMAISAINSSNMTRNISLHPFRKWTNVTKKRYQFQKEISSSNRWFFFGYSFVFKGRIFSELLDAKKILNHRSPSWDSHSSTLAVSSVWVNNAPVPTESKRYL